LAPRSRTVLLKQSRSYDINPTLVLDNVLSQSVLHTHTHTQGGKKRRGDLEHMIGVLGKIFGDR
jgi:hypothetical protein